MKVLVYFLLICVLTKQIQTLDSSINQNVNQKIKGAINGAVNQIISQDIKNNQDSNPSGAVNQNIDQNIENIEDCQGNSAGSINQNIHQKVARGSTLIDEKTVKEIANRCNSCENEFIIKRHRSNCGCKDRDSSEEIKVCDGKHTSEIIIKNRETNCKDLNEKNSDEITIKYGCETPEESDDTSEEIIVKRPKPCSAKSSEELDIKTFIRPCSDCQYKDVSSEEINCSDADAENSTEEHIIEESQEEDSFESKPKLPPCQCKGCLESSEELFGYANSCASPESESDESENSEESKEDVESEEKSEDRWSWIKPPSVKRPIPNCGCRKRHPKLTCSSCKHESSEEQQAIFY